MSRPYHPNRACRRSAALQTAALFLLLLVALLADGLLDSPSILAGALALLSMVTAAAALVLLSQS